MTTLGVAVGLIIWLVAVLASLALPTIIIWYLVTH